jgi:hypothetical protein
MVTTADLSRHAAKFYGKYSGIVAADSQPDARGRILVQVPSIFGEKATVVARPCFPYGHFFVPPPGAHVWVEFEAGMPQYPIWVGVWYPEGQAPAEAQDEPQTERVLQTPFGHTMVISDKEGEEKITLRHGGNAFLALDKDGSALVANAKGANLFLDAEGKAATLQSAQGHMVTLGEDAILVANKDGASVEIKGDTVNIIAPKINLSGNSVGLGAGAMEPTVMGLQFKILWAALQAHVHPTAMGPTLPSPMLAPLVLVDGVHLSGSVVVK